MPGFTPNFAIEYPCAGETIDATVFQTFADDVEAALAQVDAANAAALQRPRGQKLLDPGQSIATTVLTTLTYTSTVYATGITDTATGFTILSDGVYMVTLQCLDFTAVASNDYWSARILRTGTTVYQRKLFAGTTSQHHMNVSGLLTCVAGDTLSSQYQWQGGGGPVTVLARFSASKVCDL